MNKPLNARRHYIQIASAKFATDGFHGTSLASLAREAGVTKQALLHFFASKDRLYAEVLDDFARRQCDQIDAVAAPDPVRHLRQYFATLNPFNPLNPRDRNPLTDTRLTVRALLESRQDARSWPLKPYLEKLIGLVRQTPGGKTMTDQAALAWIFYLVGAVQYLVISSTAIEQMFGQSAWVEMEREFMGMIDNQICGLHA